MLSTKLFIVKDRATIFPIMVTKLQGNTPKEVEILVKAGYFNSPYRYSFMDLVSRYTTVDINDVKIASSRSHRLAYRLIYDNFDKYKSGDVIDVTGLE